MSDCSASDEQEVQLEREGAFWAAFEIDADWAEYFPTLVDMADGADVVALGRVARIEPGTSISSAPEDIVAEAILEIEVVETIRGSSQPSAQMSLVYNRPVQDAADVPPALDELGCHLPADPVLFLLRQRQDRDQQYRVVNGYGLWATTRRAVIDAPLNPELPSESIFADEITQVDSIVELADTLRE